MSTISLDTIRAAAEAKYGSLDIELEDGTVRLLNPLRLSKENRKALADIQGGINSDESETDQEEMLADALRLVAQSEKHADKLLAAIGGDLTVLAEVFENYVKGTSAGEASGSRD
ncbi:phage tail assembly protein [Micromonospora sp. NPDC048839]|uniref:phage tail assembly protein n=1 Tax=Micromonospora sp. NPDC048839 TaxID=3155641 RepID=UPI0033DC88FC